MRAGGQALSGVTMVNVLAQDGDLARYVPAQQLTQVRGAALAPVRSFGRGVHAFLLPQGDTGGHLGLLVLDGLLARHVGFDGVTTVELVGPGDLLRPWAERRAHARPTSVRWEVLTACRMASLDAEFARRVRPWPEISAALIDRAIERTECQLLLSAIRQARRVEDRVHAVLWHFAGRWGVSGPDDRSLRLPGLTGTILAQVVGARRQSVSTALGQLTDRGVLARGRDGVLQVRVAPPALPTVALAPTVAAAPSGGRRLADTA